MRIDKTIKGEKIPYYIKFVLNTMTAEIRYFKDSEPVIGIIDSEFKFISLPDTFLSPYITNHGRIPVGKLKIPNALKLDAMGYNSAVK